MSDILYVVCSTDANYIMPTGVMMKSVSIHNAQSTIIFHVVIDESVNVKNRQELSGVLRDNVKHQVEFHLIDGHLFDNFPKLGEVKHHVTKATYYRLLFTQILPDHIDKVLYLDGDIIVTQSLSDLWMTNLEDYAVGAVTDMSEEIQEYDRLGYDRNLGYFNAGMLLINLKYWRENDLTESFMNLIAHHPDCIKFHDQDVLNICLKDTKKMLPFKWNFQDGLFYTPERIEINEEKYQREVNMAILDHAIIHYTSMAKPWHNDCLNPFREEWIKVLQETVWKNYKFTDRFPVNKWRKLIGDILRRLHLRPRLIENEDYPYRI